MTCKRVMLIAHTMEMRTMVSRSLPNPPSPDLVANCGLKWMPRATGLACWQSYSRGEMYRYHTVPISGMIEIPRTSEMVGPKHVYETMTFPTDIIRWVLHNTTVLAQGDTQVSISVLKADNQLCHYDHALCFPPVRSDSEY